MDIARKLAELVVQYSTAVQPGQVVSIEGSTEALPLISKLYRAVIRTGGHPLPRIEAPGLHYILLHEGNDEQLAFGDPLSLSVVEKLVDVGIRVVTPTGS